MTTTTREPDPLGQIDYPVSVEPFLDFDGRTVLYRAIVADRVVSTHATATEALRCARLAARRGPLRNY